MAGDWEYEEFDEAEPYEAEPYEAEPYEAADPYESEAEYEPEYDGESAPYRRDQRRPLPPVLRGVQTATVATPKGPATIQLPSKVPTLAELNRVQRELVATKRRMRQLSVDVGRSRRASRSSARADDRGARNGILILALESVRDVLRDVGTYSLISDVVSVP
jgi:hypothetical protein